MYVLQNKYVQMAFEFLSFGNHNDYEDLVDQNDTNFIQKLFYRSYLIFGGIVRPVFMDTVGPFIAFIGYF